MRNGKAVLWGLPILGVIVVLYVLIDHLQPASTYEDFREIRDVSKDFKRFMHIRRLDTACKKDSGIEHFYDEERQDCVSCASVCEKPKSNEFNCEERCQDYLVKMKVKKEIMSEFSNIRPVTNADNDGLMARIKELEKTSQKFSVLEELKERIDAVSKRIVANAMKFGEELDHVEDSEEQAIENLQASVESLQTFQTVILVGMFSGFAIACILLSISLCCDDSQRNDGKTKLI